MFHVKHSKPPTTATPHKSRNPKATPPASNQRAPNTNTNHPKQNRAKPTQQRHDDARPMFHMKRQAPKADSHHRPCAKQHALHRARSPTHTTTPTKAQQHPDAHNACGPTRTMTATQTAPNNTIPSRHNKQGRKTINSMFHAKHQTPESGNHHRPYTKQHAPLPPDRRVAIHKKPRKHPNIDKPPIRRNSLASANRE